MDSIKIDIMNLNDLEQIKDILVSDFDDFWSYNVLKDELQNASSKYIVAKIHDNIVGFAGIKIIIDEADIMNIVTKKSHRNMGIGSLLLENLIGLCNDLSSITLEVNEDNLPAIHIYEKFGFKIIGVRKNYYDNKDGILMRKDIKGRS